MAWLEVYKGDYPVPIGAERFAAQERDAARRATGIIYGSQWAKDDAVQRFGVPHERVHVQPLGQLGARGGRRSLARGCWLGLATARDMRGWHWRGTGS